MIAYKLLYYMQHVLALTVYMGPPISGTKCTVISRKLAARTTIRHSAIATSTADMPL